MATEKSPRPSVVDEIFRRTLSTISTSELFDQRTVAAIEALVATRRLGSPDAVSAALSPKENGNED